MKNYFEDFPDWFELILDNDIYNDVISHNPIMVHHFSSNEVDGFYMKDKVGYLILVDSTTLQTKVYLPHDVTEIRFGRPLTRAVIDDKVVYYRNKIIIKNNKKFYKVLSADQCLFLEKIRSKIPFAKKILK